MRFKIAALSLAVLPLTLAGHNAAAQSSVPATVDAGRVGKDLDHDLQPLPQESAAPTKASPLSDAPAGAEEIHFQLNDIRLVGAKVIPHSTIEPLYADLRHKEITLAQIYELTNKITLMYRKRGYLLTQAAIPPQEIENGIVTIQVVEGFLSDYHVQGDATGARAQIQAYARKLIKAGPLTSAKLERYLLLMNDLPGVSVRSVLEPSPNIQGAAEITFLVKQKKWQGLAGIDSMGNRYLGPMRLLGGLQSNSLFGGTDQLNGTILVTGERKELAYYNLGYRQNIGNEGTKIGVSTSYTKTDPTLPDDLGGLLEPQGEAFSLSLSSNHPFIRSRKLNLSGNFSLEATKNKTTYGPGLSVLKTSDNQRIARAGIQFNNLDNLGGYLTANATISHGFEVLGSSKKGETGLSRAAGDPSFTKFTAELQRQQHLFGPFSALVGVSGQYSSNPLLASEEFGFGGADYGRGYDSSEITGDHGAAGKLELAYSRGVGKPLLQDYQVYTFYDIGATWERDPGAGQQVRTSAASTGIGTRFNFTPSLYGDAFIAKPLTMDIPSRGTDSRDLRFKFSIVSNF